MKKSAIIAALSVLAIFLWYKVEATPPLEPVPVGFSNADIAGIEARIRTKYTAGGFDVKDVRLIKVAEKKLSGFAELEKGWIGQNGDCQLMYDACLRQAMAQNGRNESQAGPICAPLMAPYGCEREKLEVTCEATMSVDSHDTLWNCGTGRN